MPKLNLWIDEWYPVFFDAHEVVDCDFQVDLTQEQIDDYKAVAQAFDDWQAVFTEKHAAYLKEKRNAKTK